jgi:hypothetical protein
MIRMSSGRETLYAVVVVAFERSDGRVIGTFVHGSHGSPDQTGIERSRNRFMKEMREQRGREAELDSVVVVPLQELAGQWIERVDPKTPTVLKSGPKTGGPFLFR